jgi:hypothetical protein
MIILKWISERWYGVVWFGSIWLRIVISVGITDGRDL